MNLSFILDAVVFYLAQPVKARNASAVDPRSFSEVLREGDVLLTSGNTRAARLVTRVTGSPWAHVCMYVGALADEADAPCIVEADLAAGVRAIRLSDLAGQQVQVLRATGLADADRRRLVDWVISHIGDRYDLARAWAVAARLLRLPWVGRVPSTAGAVAEGARRFICSSLVAQAFLMVGLPIAPTQVRVRPGDAADHEHVTPRDFERASGFQVVRNPPAV